MRRAVLDLGHTGLTGGKPPARAGGLCERRVLWRYGIELALELDLAGWVVEIAGAGTYRSRQLAAHGADVYLALHVNAGWRPEWSPRGALFHTPEASAIAEALSVPIADQAGGCRLYDISRTGWAHGPRALTRWLGGVPGVVVEPGFIDCPEHAHMWQAGGPVRLGGALGRALGRSVPVPR